MTNRNNFAFDLGVADLIQHAAKECLRIPGLCAPLKCFAMRLDHHLQDERRRLIRLMGERPVEQMPAFESLQIDEAAAFDFLMEALDTTDRRLQPDGRLHQICQWGLLHLVTLDLGLDWGPNIAPSVDHAQQHAVVKERHSASAYHSDMQALVELLPHIVAALETSAMDSPLNLCAEHLYDGAWEVHRHLTPRVSDATFSIRPTVPRKGSTGQQKWKRLNDATAVALGQAIAGGEFADFLLDASAYLRLIGSGFAVEHGYLPPRNRGEAL